MPHLEVKVGSDRFHMETCRVNDTLRPHEIDTEHFVGRVLVRILDAPGAKEGEDGREYFKDRSRRFCIQIEGRFKKQWNGDQIHFGSDFDKFIDFPRTPFNAGMRVAKYIDPCTFYEEKPPSGRPFIMSPYCACMNVLCAWPAPSRAHDAVVVLRHTHSHKSGENSPDTPHSPLLEPEKKGDAHDALIIKGEDEDEEEDIVPREGLSRSGSKREPEPAKPSKRKTWLGGAGNLFGGSSAPKEERVLKKYWRFVGFKEDPRVRAMLEAHHATLETKKKRNHHLAQLEPPERTTSNASESSGIQEVQHGITSDHPTLRKLGTAVRSKLPKFSSGDAPGTPQLGAQGDDDVSSLDESEHLDIAQTSSPPPINGSDPSSRRTSNASAPAMPELKRITTDIRTEAEKSAKKDGLKEDDFRLAEDIYNKARLDSNGDRRPSSSSQSGSSSQPAFQSKLDASLGPWRFSDPGTDMVEDNAFIFTHESLSVPKRRKYFANPDHRKEFTYDPDVVYGASFFTDAFDFNTFNLSLGPVGLNLHKWFKTMPVRYTLRAADEEPVFCTISFQLVD